MEDFPITEAQLAGNFCETLTYGMYLVTCVSCARVLLLTGREERWRRPREIRWFMLFVGVTLFWISTFDVANGLYHNIRAFVEYKGPGGAAQDLTDISDWVNIARSVDQVVQMVLGDFVLIYRCYVVYARRWLVVVPSGVLYLGGIAMAIKLIEVEASLNHRAITLNSSEIRPWWSAFFAITMAQNTLTTGLLVWRIWRVEHENSKFRVSKASDATANSQPALRRVIRVIAESGAAYTLLVFMTFVVSVCNSNALYPLSDATLQATGICFNVIIVRSTPRRDEQFTVYDTQVRTQIEHGAGAAGTHMNLHSLRTSTVATKTNNSEVTAKVDPISNIEVSFKTEIERDDSASRISGGEAKAWR